MPDEVIVGESIRELIDGCQSYFYIRIRWSKHESSAGIWSVAADDISDEDAVTLSGQLYPSQGILSRIFQRFPYVEADNHVQ